MKIKALITTLAIIGSSSVAMARPVTVSGSANASWRFDTRPAPTTTVVRDHRVQPVIVTPAHPAALRAGTRWNAYANAGWSDRYDDGFDDGRYNRPRALVLAEGLNFGNTEYRKDLVPGAGAGRFNALRIDSDGGQTFIVKVVVEFADGGAVQVVDLNRTLRGNQSMTIDLSGSARPLHRVLVYREDGGAAETINRRHNGAFTVTAL
ncbi:MAG: hypothetical protein JWP01_3238 [Myxococcales bacterium]|nr:hypothetical protein [Myxococcales bacterium]